MLASRRRAAFSACAAGGRRDSLAQAAIGVRLEVAAPQQRGALAREAIRIISRYVVIDDNHAPGRRLTTLRAPARGACVVLSVRCLTSLESVCT